jgi:hypothetical protein
MYYAIPKLDLSTYLVARITDLGSLDLVPGKTKLNEMTGILSWSKK